MDLKERVNPDPRRDLPSIDDLIRRIQAEGRGIPTWAATEAARAIVAEAREALSAAASGPAGASGSAFRDRDWAAEALIRASQLIRPHPHRVINATGVVLHTNLGRAPMAPGAAEAAALVATDYCALELDVGSGSRGNRLGALTEKMRILSGAEAAHVCNNNAAAVLLVLNTLAAGREVIVSRGELVEIGGSFRVPDIMSRAGVRLVEVGTTNRTHLRDYEDAIGPETALLLKVHRSNFEQRGFVTEVDLSELAALGKRRDLPVVEDLGSGTFVDLSRQGFPADSFVPGRLRSGADVVCFSGDKLLGGPQAGLILGREAEVERIRRNPMARALRLDKMTIAALDWTLARLLDGTAEAEIPVLCQLLADVDELEARARDLEKRVLGVTHGAVSVAVRSERVPVGGGSLPGFELDTRVVALEPERGADRLAASLRAGEMPVLTRVRDGAVLFDLRTLRDTDLPEVVDAIAAALR